MKKIIFVLPFLLIACSTPERPKNEDTNLIWGQEDKSIEDIFGSISKDDHYHSKNKTGGFWPGGNDERFARKPASAPSDCNHQHNNWGNNRRVTSLNGVNRNGLTNQTNTYEVRGEHETLMLVAYKIYGDYSLWRTIADLNQDILNGGIDIQPGMHLKYWIPVEGYSFVPEGNPFLVRKGQSLSIISDQVYRDWRRWKEIYTHNQPFIKNPNLIYEGSTLFYVPDHQLAGKKRVKLPYSNRKFSDGSYQSNRSRGISSSSRNGQAKKNQNSAQVQVNVKSKKIKRQPKALTSSQVTKQEIIPVRKAAYSSKSTATISRIKKAIEKTHGNTEINGASKFDKYVEENFID